MAKLEVKNLSISFHTGQGKKTAVRDVSFTLEEGETLGIVGEQNSGKSVIARTILGILEETAIVEDGRINFDGRDLLRIPKKEFLTLRGDRLAMVFSDPEAVLNPTGKIGTQLTEAMVPNNKKSRREGKINYTKMLFSLTEEMRKAGVEASEIKSQISEFRRITSRAIEMREAYENAQEAVIEAGDCLEEMLLNLRRNKVKAVRNAFPVLSSACARVYNEYGIPSDDLEYAFALDTVKGIIAHYTASENKEMEKALKRLFIILTRASEPDPVPDFFAIAFSILHGAKEDPQTVSMAKINFNARKLLRELFLDDFLANTERACRHSFSVSEDEKKKALKILKRKRSVLDTQLLDKELSYKAVHEAAVAAEKTIDPLSVRKDTASKMFRRRTKASLNQYFKGIKYNPKEQQRYEKEIEKHDRIEKKGRTPFSVAPMDSVDLEHYKNQVLRAFDELIEDYGRKERIKSFSDKKQATELVAFLENCAAQAAHQVTSTSSRHRAIALMQELDIPEPYLCFPRYPYEFSREMLQRMGIAIALSADPDLLICDDPTRNLDLIAQKQILTLIRQLKKERRLTVIFLTRSLAIAREMSDRVIELQQEDVKQ